MTQEVINNAVVLYRLGVDRQEVSDMMNVYEISPEFKRMMTCPVIPGDKKNAVIDKVCEKAGISKILANYTKVMSRLGYMYEFDNIINAFYTYWDKQNHIVRADIVYAGSLGKEDEDEAVNILKKKYPDCDIKINKTRDDSLIGGYVIRVHNKEYDRSYEDRLRQLERKLAGR